MIKLLKKASAFVLVLSIMTSVFSVAEAATTSSVKWESLFKTKTQQIENEYKTGKRSKDSDYSTVFFSLQDINLDGVPELYHAMLGKKDGEYVVQDGSEEIYYIKNGKATLGKINSHKTLGLIPTANNTATTADTRWQFAAYNNNESRPAFITKDTFVTEDSINVIISELSFDVQKGVLSTLEVSNGVYPKGAVIYGDEGYKLVRYASTYSTGVNFGKNLWEWSTPYVIEEDSKTTVTTNTQKSETWQDGYKKFVLEGEYTKNSRQKYYTENEDEIVFGMCDLNGDGTPELIIKNGATDVSKKVNYVYTFKSNAVSYLGEIGEKHTAFYVAKSKEYTGVFCRCGEGELYECYYYYLENSKIKEELVCEEILEYANSRFVFKSSQKTKDYDLYDAYINGSEKLTTKSLKEINRMGWDKFVDVAYANNVAAYEDVSLSSWYYDAVEFVSKKGLMSGVSSTKFAPDNQITRAMFITMLYRLDKEPNVVKVNYKDVPADSWYANAVSWANRKNIAKGISETSFAPDSNITREQLVTILYRFAKYKNKNTTTDKFNIKSYLDNNEVSEYAVDSMNWAIGNNLISGTSDLKLSPSSVATRAQAAIILQRFCEKYNF